jgi:hypothetical protein
MWGILITPMEGFSGYTGLYASWRKSLYPAVPVPKAFSPYQIRTKAAHLDIKAG